MAVRVKFLRDELFEHLGRGAGHPYLAGEVYNFDRPFADRWERRGIACVLAADVKAPADRFVAVEPGDAAKAAAAEAERLVAEKVAADEAEAERLAAEKAAADKAEADRIAAAEKAAADRAEADRAATEKAGGEAAARARK